MSGATVRRAAAHGENGWLKRLFQQGANPCECDAVGCTPLHYAAMNGHVESVLICAINDRGTDPIGERAWALQQQTSAGWTALHITVEEGLNAPEVTRALLSVGCDPWLEDNNGMTVFELAERRFARCGNASTELVVNILRRELPSNDDIASFREQIKEEHWVQAVRRDNAADIADFQAGKRDPRAPVVPQELRVAENYHLPFAVENFQAIRGAYGVQSIRNLSEARAEATANVGRRFSLAHSRELLAKSKGETDFRTLPHHRVDATEIQWSASNEWRHLRDGIQDAKRSEGGHSKAGFEEKQPMNENTLLEDPRAKGYHPFRFTAKGKAVTKAQRRMQRRRPLPWEPKDPTGSTPPQRLKPFSKYIFEHDPTDAVDEEAEAKIDRTTQFYTADKWLEIQYGKELFGKSRERDGGDSSKQKSQAQNRAALKKEALAAGGR